MCLIQLVFQILNVYLQEIGKNFKLLKKRPQIIGDTCNCRRHEYYLKERFLCKLCLKRYGEIRSLIFCNYFDELIQNQQNQFLERISLIIFKNIYQIFQLQKYLQDQVVKGNLYVDDEQLLDNWKDELIKIASLNSFYGFKKIVENFCYSYYLHKELAIQILYQKKYENQMKAINECNFFHFKKFSQKFDFLVPIKKSNTIIQQPGSQFLFHIYFSKDEGQVYDQGKEIIYCTSQDTILPILPFCIQGNENKSNLLKLQNENDLIQILLSINGFDHKK